MMKRSDPIDFHPLRDPWLLGDVLARYRLPPGTTFEEARGWAADYLHDHPGTAVEMRLDRDKSLRVTVFEVWVPAV
jgi:hypothetical protein